MLAVSLYRQDTIAFPGEDLHLTNARVGTVCSLSSDVSSRRSLHRRCSATRSSNEVAGGIFPNGAADGARTRDLHHGKVALYQLSYCRVNKMPFCTKENWPFGILEANHLRQGLLQASLKKQDAVDQFSRLYLIAACFFTALREGIEPSSDG